MRTETTVRHTKCGRMRGMVVGEGGRSSGVLLYCDFIDHATRWRHYRKGVSYVTSFLRCLGLLQWCVSFVTLSHRVWVSIP